MAAGHGRGYGVNTRLAWRRLPAILTSGLWRALDRERVARPAALVTDVGNELLYGLGVTAVATAVRDAAAATGSVFLDQPGEWYGFDAIHVRRPRLAELWQRVGDAWGLPPARHRPRAELVDWAVLAAKPAEVRSLAGRPLLTQQPVVPRAGLRVWMY